MYNVIAPKPGEVIEVTILDAMILGLDCHWVEDPVTKKGSSKLCFDFEGDCPHHAQRKLWLGWLAVLDHTARQRAVLRLGRDSALNLAKRAEPFSGLRGLRLNCLRKTQGATGSLFYEDVAALPQVPLPAAHAIEPTICLVLGCQRLPDFRVTEDDLRGDVG